MAATGAGLTLIEDEGLLAENAGLTEWPVPLLGRFDEAFLAVPPEVIQLTARVNQKYFVCRDSAGQLANAFVCTATIDAADGGERIVAGNAKVLAARLSDAKFFYETDLKTPLDALRPKLDKIVFHEKLGTVADKVERVAKLARWLVESGVVKGADPAHAELAAQLAKADLVTGKVGEFPELQGLMGGYYAAAQGEPVEVAEAVRDHYKPVGQGDDVPSAPVTVAVALADKLDTVRGFFLIGELPTGSKDPFALRRAALGVIRLIMANGLRGELGQWLTKAVDLHLNDCLRYLGTPLPAGPMYLQVDGDGRRLMADGEALISFPVRGDAPFYRGVDSEGLHPAPVIDFVADRLKVQQREAGVRHDLIDAVFALGGEDDLVRLLARVHALQAFVTTEDGTNLLAGYKRAANILKKEAPGASKHIPETGEEDPLAMVEDPDFAQVVAELARTERAARDYDREPAEAALIAALDAAEPQAAQAVEAEDFAGAMAALASLRAPIDAFFTDVTVNDADPHKRTARLALLARVRDAVHRVADFSKIEG